jgi:Tol biopolymer transport system component/DNA-binding winged helix-turn-helix (wHTH) protein
VARRSDQPELIELDLTRFEVRRSGRRVNLERIPMELLILLVKKQGALATREEIVDALWGKNPYLDTERNINTAISKIRLALGDKTDSPRFVETVVGKGYRFVYPFDPSFTLRDTTRGLPPDMGNPERVSLAGKGGVSSPAIADDPGLSTFVGGVQQAGPVESATPPLPASVQATRPNPVRRHSRQYFAALGVCFAISIAVFYYAGKPVPPPKIEKYVRVTNGGQRKIFQIGNLYLPILSDGLRLFFTLPGAGGKFSLAQVAKGGGNVGPLNSPLDSPTPLAISPDSSEILLASPSLLMNDPVWIQPLVAGSPRRLGAIAALSASWSPGGRRMAYSNLSGLFLANGNGSGSRLLLKIDQRTGQEPFWIRWSPDGARLRFSLYDPKTDLHSLWEIFANGQHLRQLFPRANSLSNVCCGNWTADGKYFVFAAMRGGVSDIWAMPDQWGFFRREDQTPVQLTQGPISFSAPLPSRDGKSIFAMGEEPRGQLVRYVSATKTFAPYLSGISASGVDFSKDGKAAAYVLYPGQTLWRCRADGEDRVQMTFPPMRVFLPRWSPDGKQIVFYGRLPGEPNKIYLISSQGGPPVQVMPGVHHEIDPNWSPDGGSFVFEKSPWEERGPARETGIYTFDLKTRQASELPGSRGFVSPRWSPDGRYILAMPSDSSGLVLFDFQKHAWTQIARLHIGYPNWSHDGKYIYFDRFESPPGIGRLRVSDHKVEQMVALRDDQQLWTLDTWTGLAPDDSPMLMHDASIEEIYALQWTAP